jgi:hypothetical protein
MGSLLDNIKGGRTSKPKGRGGSRRSSSKGKMTRVQRKAARRGGGR